MINFLTKYRHALYALFLLLPSYVGVRTEFYFIFIGLVFAFERIQIKKSFKDFRTTPFSKKHIVVWLVIAIMIFSGLNKILNGDEIICLRDYYASFYMFPFLVLSSRFSFDLRLFKYLVLLVAIECVVAMFEYLSGYRSFFPGIVNVGDDIKIEDYSLFYNSRVFGLSLNSTFLGVKLLIAFILVDFVKFKRWVNWGIRIVLLIGLVVSFSRIVVLVLLIYWMLSLFVEIIKNRKIIFNSTLVQFYGVVLILALVFQSNLRSQFARGSHQAESSFNKKKIALVEPTSCAAVHALPLLPGELDPNKQGWGDKLMMGAESFQSSGRKLIWLNYINFIQDNLWFGNGSVKLMLRSWIEEDKSYTLVHAHNSFIMMVSTNGLIISGLYFLFYVFFFKSRNYLAIMTIILYSMGNFGIFWGFSFLDVIFIFLLFNNLNLAHDDKG